MRTHSWGWWTINFRLSTTKAPTLSAAWFARAWLVSQGVATKPILTPHQVFHSLAPNRAASPILPTAPVPDPRLWHAEQTPSKFLSARLQRHSRFFEQICPPAKDAVADNAGARPGVPP